MVDNNIYLIGNWLFYNNCSMNYVQEKRYRNLLEQICKMKRNLAVCSRRLYTVNGNDIML